MPRNVARPVSEINITPLIDVMLVLLIIFMAVAPVARRGLDAALPQPSSSRSTDDPDAILVSVDALGLTLNGNPVFAVTELEARLRDIVGLRNNKTVFVRAAGAIPYARVVEVVDAARGAGAGLVGLVLEPRP